MAPPPSPTFLFLLLSLLSSVSASPSFSPADNHLISCGAAAEATLADGRVFVPDSSALSSSRSHLAASDGDAGGLYGTARVFTWMGCYRFGIKTRGTHLVRLHFRPFSAEGFDLRDARFHVSAAGSVLLADFGVKEGPLVKEFLLWVDSDELVVKFLPSDKSSFGFVNAVEVVSAPARLVADAARSVAPDGTKLTSGLVRQGLETLFRVNVGGPKVTPFNDTLWRTWIPDVEFLKPGSTASETVHFGTQVRYRDYGATREVAPDNVYNTARIIRLADVSTTNSNMTWEFSVPHGFRYFIRLHFCDIASLALNEIYFNVYINGYMAYEDLDISKETGGTLAAPYYMDFIAEPDLSNNLAVTIAPSKNSSAPNKVDGLLNGLEIMKMNTSVGFVDSIPVDFMLSSTKGGGFGTCLRLVLSGFLLLALVAGGVMLVTRWRNASRVSSGWTRVPVDIREGKGNYGIPLPGGKSMHF